MVNKNGIGVGTEILNNVAYSPQIKYNLCSLSTSMDDGWKMTGDTKGIMMVKKGRNLVFDIIIRTDTQLVYCLYFNCMTNELACTSITHRKPWSINDAHEQLGHLGKDLTHEILKGLNLNVQQGQMVICWACTVAKAMQKNAMQFSLNEKSQVPGEVVFGPVIHATASRSVGTAQVKLEILVDECTNFKISHFIHRKDQMAETTCQLLTAWRDKGIMMKFVWLDKLVKTIFLSRGWGARIGSLEFRWSIH